MSTGSGTRTIGVDEMCRLLPLWLTGAGFMSRPVGDGRILRVYGSPGRTGAFFGGMFRGVTLVGGEMRFQTGKGYVDIVIVNDGIQVK